MREECGRWRGVRRRNQMKYCRGLWLLAAFMGIKYEIAVMETQLMKATQCREVDLPARCKLCSGLRMRRFAQALCLGGRVLRVRGG